MSEAIAVFALLTGLGVAMFLLFAGMGAAYHIEEYGLASFLGCDK